MSFNQDQGPKRVRFADNPEVHAYTPDTSPSSASSSELRTPSDNGALALPLPLPSMANYIAPCMTWAPGFVPSAILVPPGYVVVAPPAPAPAGYRVPVPIPIPISTPAIPARATQIHPALARPPFQWDVRAALPPADHDHPYRSEPAFAPPVASITLRFPRADFVYPIVSAGVAALRVVDVLRAVHDALYTRADVVGPAVRRAAEVAQGYRALKRDRNAGELLRVDMYPVSPNRAGGARLFFMGLEWGEGKGEVRVLLGPEA